MMLLRGVAALYALSGVWCLLQPELAAGFLALAFTAAAGKAEFVSVYGGLQLGLAIALVWVPLNSLEQQLAATRFAALVSLGLLIARCISLLSIAVTPALLVMA
ncbi:MAG: hypothetical protein R3183_02255, partial [Oleiphilaceae bacterium]|nr:hypothetical protein [Oleiphilaceae bacterium]